MKSLLSVLKTDIHSHLIPRLDDGVSTDDEAIDCIIGLSKLGYKKLIITPHVISNGYNNTIDTIQNGLKYLQEIIQKEQINIVIEASAEYYLDDDFIRKINTDDLLPFGKKKYILFEMPYYSTFGNLYEIIFALHTNGYTPVLAHPERYFYYHHNFSEYKNLRSKGVLFQMNIVSLMGSYSPGAKKTAEKLINENMIDFIGSDTHSISYINAINNLLLNKYLIKLIKSDKLLNSTL